MLFETHDHLFPQLTAPVQAPLVSPTSPYTTGSAHDRSFMSTHAVHRLQRRNKAAPYYISSTAPPSSSSSSPYHIDTHVHAPQPVQTYTSPQVLQDTSPISAYLHSPQNICTGVHGTILGSFSPRSGYGLNSPGGLTVTPIPATDTVTSSEIIVNTNEKTCHVPPAPSSSAFSAQVPIIKMPKIPKIPGLGNAHIPTPGESSAGAITTNGTSELHSYPRDNLPPAQNTFPTPSELLNELTQREQGTLPDARRAKRRKTPLSDSTSAGYAPTDPYVPYLDFESYLKTHLLVDISDTLSSHDKKRHYLDCVEQYIQYLHHQIRLVGVEPVPIERVSSGRGLTSRSIRVRL